jgi:hypothetical protein
MDEVQLIYIKLRAMEIAAKFSDDIDELKNNTDYIVSLLGISK